MPKFYFRRLYRRIGEGESIDNSIIAFKSVPVKFDNKIHSNGYTEVVPIKYYRKLFIDLWLFYIIFKWEYDA